MLPLLTARTYEEGLPLETGIPGFWDSAVLVSGGIGADTIYSSAPKFGSEEPVSVSVSVSRSCTGISRYTGRLERQDYRPRQRMGPIGRDVRGTGACLHHHTTD